MLRQSSKSTISFNKTYVYLMYANTYIDEASTP